MKFYVARSKKSGNFVSFTHIVDDQGDFSDNIPMESFQRGAMPFMWMEKEIAKLCDSVFPGHNLKNDIEFIPVSIEFLFNQNLAMTNGLVTALIQAIEASGFSVAGPTDIRAAEHEEPAWVCNARAAIAEATVLHNCME